MSTCRTASSFKRKHERAGQAARFHAEGSGLHELAALVAEDGFTVVKMEEMPSPCFSVFPGASFVRIYKRSDAQAIREG
jgi:hypothetical protein